MNRRKADNATSTDNTMNPMEKVPEIAFKLPNRFGTKNPPKPPNAPIKPVMIPISLLNLRGTSWNTEPFPKPKKIIKVMKVGRIIPTEGNQETAIRHEATPANTPSKTVTPPNLSERYPPIGRTKLAPKIQ